MVVNFGKMKSYLRRMNVKPLPIGVGCVLLGALQYRHIWRKQVSLVFFLTF